MEQRRKFVAYWDAAWKRHAQGVYQHPYEPWLERWRDLWSSYQGGPVLDLGCGVGRDTCYLTTQGLCVVAADRSEIALRQVRAHVPQAIPVVLDIGDCLPFGPASFPLIVANLSLHYFGGAHACEIMDHIVACLQMGGWLLARFNSVNDAQYGAVGHREVEPSCFLINGRLKRFFDRKALVGLFADHWTLHSLDERIFKGYGKPKVLWEVAVRRK